MSTNAELPEIIGKETSDKLLAQEAEVKPRTAEGARNEAGLGTRKLEGLDLKVGGKMHRLLYDEQFPQAANKLGKKFGGRSGRERYRPGRHRAVEL